MLVKGSGGGHTRAIVTAHDRLLLADSVEKSVFERAVFRQLKTLDFGVAA